ncbi:MAG: heme-copper oxidase subunit III [Chloroflexi bacterium]|nr:heme-copper oxidase subunit III [Chloroflexota bacterium]
MSEVSIQHTDVSVSQAAARAKAKALRVSNYKFAMWLYLASEVVIFGTLIAAYAVFRYNNPEVVHEVHKEAGVLLVAINTFLLLMSSWCMVMGLRDIQMGNRQGLIRWIAATAVLGTVFIALQAVEYSVLSAAGVLMTPGAEFHAFAAHFYPPTFFHGLHVFVGVLWAVIWVIIPAMRGSYGPGDYLGVEFFGLYWHFVDVVWIVLFTVIYLW